MQRSFSAVLRRAGEHEATREGGADQPDGHPRPDLPRPRGQGCPGWLAAPTRGGVRGASTRKPTGCRTSLWPSLPAALHALLTNPMWLLTSLGYSAYTFVIGALAFWGPTLVTQVSLRCVHASGACKHTSGHRLHSEPMQFQYPQVRS